MKNEYEIRGDTTAIFLRRKDGSRLETLIDTADLPRAMGMPYEWCAMFCKNNSSFYAYTNIPTAKGKRKCIRLHRWITNPKDNEEVDHLFHDTLDNRRRNLRKLPKGKNKQNCKGAYKTNKSGIRGVTWNKQLGKWYACYRLNGHLNYVGIFDNLIDAEKAITKARAEICHIH
jgi:hypothetical protein